jgi:peroxiredoxin
MSRIIGSCFRKTVSNVETIRGERHRIDRGMETLVDVLDAGSGNRRAAGDAAPAFVLPDTDRHQVTVNPAEHAATVLVFTSNACPYALAWHDRLQQVARDYAGRGVETVQIVSNDDQLQPADSLDAMRARERAGEIAGRYLKDAEQAVARRYGATATPEVYVVDSHGVIRYHGVPDVDHDDPKQAARLVRDALDSVLSGQPVAVPETSPAGCSLKWRVELLWWDGCPSHEEAGRLLDSTLDAMGRSDVRVRRVHVGKQADAAARAFPGSPTFQVGGLDLFPSDAPPALGCRVYQRPDGRLAPLPSADQLRERLREALARPWDLPGWTDIRRKTADRKGAS